MHLSTTLKSLPLEPQQQSTHPTVKFSDLLYSIIVYMCPGAIVILLAVSVQRCCTGLNIETPLRPCSVYSLSDEPAWP